MAQFLLMPVVRLDRGAAGLPRKLSRQRGDGYLSMFESTNFSDYGETSECAKCGIWIKRAGDFAEMEAAGGTTTRRISVEGRGIYQTAKKLKTRVFTGSSPKIRPVTACKKNFS
jgi:hypothetical protein